MSDERKPLPETGFRCYGAKPEKITCNMVILIDQMISWLEAERASGANVKKDGRGQDTIRLTMAETTKKDAKLSHYFRYDDFDPNDKGGYQRRDNVTPMPMPPVDDGDIPF
jgi:hypothetical protein